MHTCMHACTHACIHTLHYITLHYITYTYFTYTYYTYTYYTYTYYTYTYYTYTYYTYTYYTYTYTYTYTMCIYIYVYICICNIYIYNTLICDKPNAICTIPKSSPVFEACGEVTGPFGHLALCWRSHVKMVWNKVIKLTKDGWNLPFLLGNHSNLSFLSIFLEQILICFGQIWFFLYVCWSNHNFGCWTTLRKWKWWIIGMMVTAKYQQRRFNWFCEKFEIMGILQSHTTNNMRSVKNWFIGAMVKK